MLVRLTKQNGSKEMYSPIGRHVKTMKNTSAFDTWSSSGVRRGIVNNKRIVVLLPLLVCLLLFFLVLLLFTIPLLTPDKDQVSKALVFFIFFTCRRIGQYISLEPFCYVDVCFVSV